MTFYVHLFIHQSNDLSSYKLYLLTSDTGVNQNYEYNLEPCRQEGNIVI